MQKIAIGMLAVLALFLAARNTRLVERERHLAERIAVLEAGARKAKSSTPIAAAIPEPVAIPPVAQQKPAAPSAQTPAPPPANAPAHGQDAATIRAAELAAKAQEELIREAFANGTATFTLTATKQEIEKAGTDEALGLSPAQKTAINELRKQRDLVVREFEDRMASVTEQTEQSIRGLLTPEQVAKYDAERAPVQETLTVQAPQETLNSSGRKPGFLGINGNDAQGGGTMITQVFPNTVAAGLGLQKDDVILEFNGAPVAGLGDLASKIREAGEGAPATIRIRRNGTEFYQGLQLGGWSK